MISEVKHICQKHIFTHIHHQSQLSGGILFFSLTVKEWKAKNCGVLKSANDTSMVPSKSNQMKHLGRQEVKLTSDILTGYNS